MDQPSQTRAAWRERTHEIIFEADTRAGKLFDVALLIAILLSVLAVMLDSVYPARTELRVIEWVFTILFSIEYILRLSCVGKPHRYALSFFGVVDLLAILPTYIALFVDPESGAQALLVIRALRLLRVFRVLKLARYLSEAKALRRALWVARAKIAVFLTTILIVVAILGSAMYIIEGDPDEVTGFDSIPQSMYWAVVTMTTVGYGDVTPQTAWGKVVTVVITLIGYTMIIVPTGIISAELARPHMRQVSTQACRECSREGHEIDAKHCKFCGAEL